MTVAEIINKPNRIWLCWASFFLLAATIAGILVAKPSDGVAVALLGAAAGPFTLVLRKYFQVKSDEHKALIAKEPTP